MAGTQPKLNYRHEVLSRFFEFVQSGESFYVIGAPSVGKTRLMDFLLGDNIQADLAKGVEPDRLAVKKRYLGEDQALSTWLVRVDLNRIRQEHDWSFHFYELLLSAVFFECSRYPVTDKTREMEALLAELDSQVIRSKDALMAHRFFEMAVNKLCQVYRIKLCFLFDEFDETYKKMPLEVFAQLRAIRDANKYRLFYALFLRNLPEALRSRTDNESFFELISRNLIGIGPYTQADSMDVIEQLEQRKNFSLTPEKRNWLFLMSGGHPGLMIALFDALRDNPQQALQNADIDWCFSQEHVREEFRKIWNGLLDDEKSGLLAFARNDPARLTSSAMKILRAKGLLRQDGRNLNCFSPLFPLFLEARLRDV